MKYTVLVFSIISIPLMVLMYTFNSNSIYQAPKQYEFVVMDSGNDYTDYVIQSCNPKEIYKINFLLPKKDNEEISPIRKRTVMPTHELLAVKEAYWKENCLMLPAEEKTDEYILNFIQTITNLNKENIKIINK